MRPHAGHHQGHHRQDPRNQTISLHHCHRSKCQPSLLSRKLFIFFERNPIWTRAWAVPTDRRLQHWYQPHTAARSWSVASKWSYRRPPHVWFQRLSSFLGYCYQRWRVRLEDWYCPWSCKGVRRYPPLARRWKSGYSRFPALRSRVGSLQRFLVSPQFF